MGDEVMVRDEFLTNPNDGYAGISNKMLFDQMWKRLLAYEEKTGLSVDDGLTREQYVDLLNSMKIRKTSMHKNFKSALLYYVRYLIARGVLPPEQEDILASVQVDDLTISTDGPGIQYFKDLWALRDAIKANVEASTSYDPTRHDQAIVILYLTWYGLSEQEIVDYLRADVLDDGIMIHGRKQRVPIDVLQVFTRLRDARGYYQKARGVIFHTYVYSEYLIRSERSGHCTTVLTRCFVARFNAITEGRYSFTYNVVRQSGIFYRAYRMECDGFTFDLNDPYVRAVASDVFCEDLSDPIRRMDRIRDYELYKQMYKIC